VRKDELRRELQVAGEAAVLPSPPPRRAPLRRIEWVLDHSGASRSSSATGVRFTIGTLFVLYGIAALALGIAHDDVQLTPLFFILGSLPIYANRLGAFGRYFVPVFLGLFAYALAASYVTRYKLTVHFAPQIDIERHLVGGGTLPTVWLQEHLYHGHTGPLEILAVAAYAGHFFVPLAFGVGLVLTGRTQSFQLLMFAILAVSILGAITFVIFPTAPPWLASEHGYIPTVHHILKRSLYDMHMTSIAALEGNASKYDVTAAVPSLHTAFPFICLLTAIHARLPKAVVALVAFDLAAVVFSIVFTGEHYVVDALAGSTYAAVSWMVVRRLLNADRAARSPRRETTFRTQLELVALSRPGRSDGEPLAARPDSAP
jgi:hypothetical protein